MNRRLKTTACLFVAIAVSWTGWCPGLKADDRVVMPSQPSGRYTLTPSELAFDNVGGGARRVPFGPRWRMITQVGDGLGWTDGNTYVSGFLPYHLNPYKDLVFVDVRGFVSHSLLGNNIGGNVGVGYRRLLEGSNTILGVSLWGDADGAYYNDYYQWGVSGEAITPLGEIRANGYIATGDVHSNVIASGIVGQPFFQAHHILLNQRTITEHQYEGFDAEFGGPLPYIGRYGFNAYLGGYYMKTDGLSAFGGVKVRGEAVVHEDIQVGFQYRYDDTFGANIWANMTLQLPNSWRDWWRKPFFRQRSTLEQLARPVVRQYRIPVERRVRTSVTALINPLTGRPFYVNHVDPNGGPGDGTFENPMNSDSFTNTNSVDIIRVLPGTFAPASTIQLYNNQRLLAANLGHLITSTQGVFPLPSKVASAVGPVLMPQSGDWIVEIRDNNEISGFTFDGADAMGLVARSGIRNVPGEQIGAFNINNNVFRNIADGVVLTNVTTPVTPGVPNLGLFTSNVVVGSGYVSSRGLSVQTTGGATNLDLYVWNSIFHRFWGEDTNNNDVLDVGEDQNGNLMLDDGIGLEIIASNGSTINAADPTNAVQPTGIVGINSGNNGTGLALTAETGGTINAVVLDSSFSNNVDNTNTGIRATADGGTINLPMVDNNLIQSNFGNGVALFTLNNGVINSVFTNNLINENLAAGMLVDANTGTVNLTAIGNNFDRLTNGVDGVRINGVNSTITANLLGNSIVGGVNFIGPAGNLNTGYGVIAEANNGILVLNIGGLNAGDGNDLSNNSDAAIFVTLDGTAISTINILGNTISTIEDNAATVATVADGDGIRLDRRTGSWLNALIANNTITNVQGDGVDVTLTGTAFGPGSTTSTVNLNNNLIGNIQGGDAVSVLAQNDAVFVMNAQFNAITNAPNGAGFHLVTENNASIGDRVHGLSSIFDGNLIATTVNGFNIDASTAGTQYNNIVISGDAGVRTSIIGGGSSMNGVLIANASTLGFGSTYIIRGTDINLNGGADGIHLEYTGTPGYFLGIGGTGANQNVTVANIGDDGIEVVQSNGIASTSGTVAIESTAVHDTGTMTGSNDTDATRGDGISLVSNTGNFTASIFNSSVLRAAGRGLNAFNNSETGVAIYNVGGTEDGVIGANMFNNNGLQGVVFTTVAQTTASLTSGPNEDITVNGNFFQDVDPALASITVVSTVNFVGNTVQGNGTANALANGMDLAVGTNTHMIAVVSGNTFGGNANLDFNTRVIRSVDPIASTSGGGATDTIVYDPLAFLSLGFGVIDSDNNGTLDARLANTGTQFGFTTTGVATAAPGDQLTGEFTNADPFKPNPRAAFMQAEIFSAGLIDGPAPGNTFVQSGVLQDVTGTFTGANVLLNNHMNPVAITGDGGAENSVIIQPAATIFPTGNPALIIP